MSLSIEQSSALRHILERPKAGSEDLIKWRHMLTTLLYGFTCLEHAVDPYDEPNVLPMRPLGEGTQHTMVDWNGDAWTLKNFLLLILDASEKRGSATAVPENEYLDVMLRYKDAELDSFLEFMFWICYENDLRCRDVVLRDNNYTRSFGTGPENRRRVVSLNRTLGPSLVKILSGDVDAKRFRQLLLTGFLFGPDVPESFCQLDAVDEPFPLLPPQYQNYDSGICRGIAFHPPTHGANPSDIETRVSEQTLIKIFEAEAL